MSITKNKLIINKSEIVIILKKYLMFILQYNNWLDNIFCKPYINMVYVLSHNLLLKKILCWFHKSISGKQLKPKRRQQRKKRFPCKKLNY
jgi:hypothetical protein